jgi:hypothetical protein
VLRNIASEPRAPRAETGMRVGVHLGVHLDFHLGFDVGVVYAK